MNRCEKIKQYIMDHGEQMIADTVMLAEHQSPTAQKEYADRCADAVEQLVFERLGLKPAAVFPQEERGRPRPPRSRHGQGHGQWSRGHRLLRPSGPNRRLHGAVQGHRH